MSTWYDVDDNDMEIDRKNENVDMLVASNDWGNIYVTLTFKQIENLYKAILKDVT